MRVSVVGTGYVGLVTGTCFAEMGNDVLCVDIDEDKVNRLKKGEVPIFEPGLADLIKRNRKEGRLTFTTNIEEVADSEIIFLALPTPPNEDGSADLSYILGVAKTLSGLLKKYTVIVDKSTVPVGTADRVSEAIASNTKVPFDVVSNPEFLREGQAVSDFMKPDRVIIGTSSERAAKLMRSLYRPYFMREPERIIVTDTSSAEMIKYAANTFLANKISFINQVAGLCELVGANVDMVRKGIGADSRIGDQFLYAGPGYGGSCFPKDVLALSKTAKDYRYEFEILDAVMAANEKQKLAIPKKVSNYFKGQLKGKKIAMWGLAFKDNTDDIRESPALAMVDHLIKKGAEVVAFDPQAMDNVKLARKGVKALTYAEDEYEALKGADALVIATNWKEFSSPDFNRMKVLLKDPIIFDGRNLYDLDIMEGTGFYYESVGRRVIGANA